MLPRPFTLGGIEMTPIEAYSRVCDYMKEKVVVVGCRNYVDYYGFYISSEGTDMTNSPKLFVGRYMTVVNKFTGNVFREDENDSIDLSDKRWRPVNNKLFRDVNIVLNR